MPASRASWHCGATRPPAPPRASRSSAISRAPPSWCSSSIACRPSARPTPRRRIPGVPGAVRVERRAQGRHRGRGIPERAPAVAASARAHRCPPRQAGRRRDPRHHAGLLPRRRLPRRSSQRSREAGVTIPILPGIMPITSPSRLRRVLELSGEDAARRPRDRARRGADDRGAAPGRRRPRRRPRPRGRRGRRARRPPLCLQRPRTVLAVLRDAGRPHPPHPEGGRTMTEPRPAFPAGTILGYPRIGRRRELKRAVEAHWTRRHRRGDARAHRRRAAPRDPRAARRARARTHRLVDPRVVLVLRPGARRRARRRRAARALRGTCATPTARSASTPYFTAARGEGENAPARDDEVVRHELPLPRPRDRARDGVRAVERPLRAPGRRGEGRRLHRPPRRRRAR